MSQYDDPDRPEREPDPSADRPGPWERPYGEPGRADGGWASPSGPPSGSDASQDEPTRPQPAYDPGYQPPSPYARPGAHEVNDGRGVPGAHEHHDTTMFPAPYPPVDPLSHGRPESHDGDRDRGSRVPGWLIPVVAVVALLVGALGGVLGAVAVSTSLSDGGGTVPAIGNDSEAAEPLAADNGSVTAVASRLLPSTVQIQAKGGSDGNAGGGATGSGFVLDGKGRVVTNNHVVADATGEGELKVVEQDGTKHEATIIGRSPVYDIAVLQVAEPEKLKPAAIGASRKMRVGDTVVAIGSPLGLSSTVTSGIVSAIDRPVTTGDSDSSSYINAVQTDAAINPGNSGGPLVNMRGQVVGVNSAIATTGGGLGGASGNIGVGFAIPMEQVQITASQILASGEARYPVIGANVNTGQQVEGAEIVEVPPGGPARDAGLEKGDVVTRVEGKPVANGIGLIVAIRSHQPGETITLTVKREGGEPREVRVKLDSKVG